MNTMYTAKLHEEYTAKDYTFKALIWKIEAFEGKDLVQLEWSVTTGCNDPSWNPIDCYNWRMRSLSEARITAKEAINNYNKENEEEEMENEEN